MEKNRIVKRHILADKIPVICSIVLMAAAQVLPMSLLADLIDPFYEKNAQAALTVYMIILIIVSFGMQWLFERWFYPEYKGSMTWEGLGAGMRYILPAIIFIAAWRAFKVGMGYETLDRPGYYLILMGARAGINEEVAFRGIGTALLFRSFRKETNCWIPAVFVGLAFGCVHLSDLFFGRELSHVLLNSFFAASMGIIFGAVFTLSGNIWPCIFLHSLYDYLAFSSEFTDLAPDGLSDFEVGVFVVMAIAFLFVLYRKREEICALWNRKWTNPLPERLMKTGHDRTL